MWDCCGGTANLVVGLTNKYRVWVSTLDQADVDVIHQRIKLGANILDSHVFQFDFLNDSFDKLPHGLKEIIDDTEKRRRLVIYINPPYAEAGDIRQRSGTGKNKRDVSVVHATYNRYLEKIGIAGCELFAQFFMRIHDEIPGCVLAEFSKLKHLQSPNFKAFRQAFHGTLEKCFIVPADTFDNVKGDFPIGFCVWRLGNDVQRRDAEAQIGFANARDARSYHVDEPVGSRVPRDRSLRLCVKDKLSPAARAVLDAGRELWRYYHAQPNANPNASFYDIRLHFQGSTTDAKGKVRMNSESSDTKYTALIGDLRKAMKALARHIEPKVYEYGFLRR